MNNTIVKKTIRCSKCDNNLDESNFYASTRHHKQTWCKDCMRTYDRVWKATNREKVNEKQREWSRNNRDKANLYCQQWRRKNKQRSNEIINKSRLKRMYGLTEEQIITKLDKQKGKCPICLIEISRETLAIDHNHSTGKVRDLLCRTCNTRLGHVEKEGWLESALKYISSHNEEICLQK